MTAQLDVFVSSKMHELAAERRALQDLLPTLGGGMFQLRTWVFEGDAPASNKSIREVYLEALRNSALYIGLFWNDYGEWTIDEYEHATDWGIERHLYVKNVDTDRRDPRLQVFLDRQSDVRFGITPRWFTTTDELKEQVARSVEKWLLDRQIAYHSATSAILALEADDVPEQPRKLIGRDDLIDDVLALLEENERVLLRGFGGMGKTALAATTAAEYVAQGNGPVLWIKAGAAEADALFEAVGRALGAQQAIASTTGDERVQAVRHVLSESGALLVLDDVWNGAALARMLKAIPRKTPLLVTSRHRFPLDEVIEVGELKPDQALKLLSYHARQRDFRDEPDARRLCELLGYHAFALEIAGKTLKVYDMAAAELLQQIESTPHDLAMPANFGELGRTGIKPLLDASVNALDKDLHDIFVTLGGMFEPSSTPDLLALVMQRDAQDVGEALTMLDTRGLVNQKHHGQVIYYRLHDLAYSYARTMFLSKGLSNQPFTIACRDYTARYKDDLDALDVEQSNILEAAETAHGADRDDLLIDTMRLLTVEGSYFAARGYTSLALNLLKTAVESASQRGDIETAHYLLSRLGNAYADFFGDLESALQAYQEALERARALHNPHREAILLTVIGTVRFRQQADDADDYHQQAERIARDHQDNVALSQILHNRGGQALFDRQTPDYERGRLYSDEAARLAEDLDLTHIYFWSLVNRGGCEHELGQFEQALSTHQEAYRVAQTQDNHYWMAGALRSIGEDYDKLGQQQAAQQAFDESLALWRQIGAKPQAADLVEHMETRNYTVSPDF